jgi:hypothetical protein
LLCGTENGATAEIAVCGNDGMVGVTVLMGQGISSNQAVVQCAGFGYRIEAGYLKSEFEQAGRAAFAFDALYTDSHDSDRDRLLSAMGCTLWSSGCAGGYSPATDRTSPWIARASHHAGTHCEHARRAAGRDH